MTNRQLRARLRKHDACSDAVQWVAKRDLATAWQECPRGDWLLWLCAKQIGEAGWPTHQQVVLAACACAETALPYVPAGEDRPRLAIEAVRAWTRGEATLAQVKAAAYAASAAYAAYASASAAYAADAGDAARALAQCADIVRSMLTLQEVTS